jgi:hypothetical protein
MGKVFIKWQYVQNTERQAEDSEMNKALCLPKRSLSVLCWFKNFDVLMVQSSTINKSTCINSFGKYLPVSNVNHVVFYMLEMQQETIKKIPVLKEAFT